MTPFSDSDALGDFAPQEIPIPEVVPILALREPVVFPHMIAPLSIEDDATRAMVDEALKGDRLIAVFPLRPESNIQSAQQAAPADLFEVGTLAVVLRMLKIPDGTVRLLVHGLSRVMIEEMVQVQPHLSARIHRLDEAEMPEDVEVEALKKNTRERLQKAIELANLSEDLAVAALNIDDPGKLADLVASNMSLKPQQVLEILAEKDPKKRLSQVHHLLSHEVHVLEIGSNLTEKVRESVDKSQRDFYLREQMRALREELGEGDPHEQELNELRERLTKTEMPEHVRKTATKELDRLAMLQPAAAEYSVIRTYLEWILDLPWNISTDDHLDIRHAAKILDEDHYGLETVKERVLEFLSVLRLKGGNLKGPILCFVGPPGVGKTSLGRSIARATGRKFTRFSLGGMRDEAEIRGHRRTYIGSMPGRIIKSLKDCGTNNPLIMLDEVDKLGTDFRGDPASALLEVLDPEQNDSFVDHYMDMPVDLSRVMFITTANSLDTIPGPLRDRMEIIRIAGYTDNEKLEIAKRYLVPREIENSGVKKSLLRFNKTGLETIITEYTAEAGVRGLQKEIANVCRKVARRVAEAESAAEEKGEKPEKMKAISISKDTVAEFLRTPKVQLEVAERMGRPGISIGLAWTSIGGDILFIEATNYPGKGELRLTGHLGDVMKESALTALSFLRANRGMLKIDDDAFAKNDFHLHVPAGATPKDGPSAGVAIASALGSLLTGRKVRDYVAMTGEISLRGNVLPVGGIKEKCLAAHRAGIKEVLLPRRNERDLDEVPDIVRKAIKFHYLDQVGDAIKLALD